MIIYDYGCAQGHVFEAAVPSMAAPDPTCPVCASPTRRRPSRVNTTGASAGVPREELPRSWRAVGNGDPEAIRHWHRLAASREKLEEKHPDLAGDRRPVLAHEGLFAKRPLRAGEDIPAAIAEAHRINSASAAGPDPENRDSEKPDLRGVDKFSQGVPAKRKPEPTKGARR
jgi:hypothetical protein